MLNISTIDRNLNGPIFLFYFYVHNYKVTYLNKCNTIKYKTTTVHIFLPDPQINFIQQRDQNHIKMDFDTLKII